LKKHAVDSLTNCHACTLRYLCGGGCRAWRNPPPHNTWQPAAASCKVLKLRAERLLEWAYRDLELSFHAQPEQ
jgi:sulfatase maturation enzyme AslB (radical SAM superfamily)